MTLTPYGTLINDATKSKTGGRWAWAAMPGANSKDQSRTFFGGWIFGVPHRRQAQGMGVRIHPDGVQQASGMQRSMLRGNAPPRVSVLNDPEMVQNVSAGRRSPPQALQTALLDPRDRDLGDARAAAAQRPVAGAARTEDGEGGAGRRGRRLAAQPAPGGDRPMIRRRQSAAGGGRDGRAADASRWRRASPTSWCSSATTGRGTGAWSRRSRRRSRSSTGIKVDFTLLPIDALSARLKAELNSGSSGIDIIQWTAPYAGWLAPHMEDHEKLLASTAGRHPDFDWDDFLPSIRDMASYQGKLLGIPYRVTASILNYQKQLLADVGFDKAPENWAEFQAALHRHHQGRRAEPLRPGIWGRQGPAMVGGFSPFLRGNGGRYFDPKTWEIQINNAKAVEALQFYGDLMTKYKVVVPDAITWEFDEIVAGGQNDRYAMTITLAPYGTLINDPKLSKTAGKWALGGGARRAFARGEPGERRRLDLRRAERVQEQGVGVRVHPVRRAARSGCGARWCAATRRRGCRC